MVESRAAASQLLTGTVHTARADIDPWEVGKSLHRKQRRRHQEVRARVWNKKRKEGVCLLARLRLQHKRNGVY